MAASNPKEKLILKEENLINSEEPLIDLEYLQKFGEELRADFVDKKLSKSLEAIPEKLREYLAQLELMQKEKREKATDEKPTFSGEKEKKNRELSAKIAREFFIFACASSKSMNESLAFHGKCNLSVKDLNDFGENNLSPLAAAMLAEKDQQDLNKLIEKGANLNAKNKFGQTAADMALAEKGGKQDVKSKQDDEERLPERKKTLNKKRLSSTDFDKKSAQEEAAKLQQQAQQKQIQEAVEAMSIHQAEMIKLVNEIKNQQNQKHQKDENERRDVQAIDEKQQLENKNITAEKTDPHEEALKKALGLKDGEKIDINELLFGAVKNGKPILALLLIRFGGDVNHKEGGISVLGAAIAGGNNSLISTLSGFSKPETIKEAFHANIGNKDVLSRLAGGAEFLKEMVRDLSAASKNNEDISRILELDTTSKKSQVLESISNDKVPKLTSLEPLKSFGGDANHKESRISVLGAAIAGENNSLISILSDSSEAKIENKALNANISKKVALNMGDADVKDEKELSSPVKDSSVTSENNAKKKEFYSNELKNLDHTILKKEEPILKNIISEPHKSNYSKALTPNSRETAEPEGSENKVEKLLANNLGQPNPTITFVRQIVELQNPNCVSQNFSKNK